MAFWRKTGDIPGLCLGLRPEENLPEDHNITLHAAIALGDAVTGRLLPPNTTSKRKSCSLTTII